MGRLIEGYWDCPYCNSRGIRGGLRECPSCGNPRGEDTKFYMKDKSYVEPSVAKTISRRPDWLCSYCERLNSDDSPSCVSCGASKSSSEKNYFEMKAEKGRKEREKRVLDQYHNSSRTSGTGSFNPISLVKPLLIVFAVFLSLWGIISLFTPKNDTLTIQGFSWERTINIEEFKTVQESDWSVPSGGRVLSTKQEVHHYNQVLDHYETHEEIRTREVIDHYEEYVSGYTDLGNGYFEEQISTRPVYKTETYYETVETPVYKQVPEYRTKYYYEIDKWVYEREIKTSGTDKEPYWGIVTLSDNEREGGKVEVLSISATNKKGKLNTYQIDSDHWYSLNVGDKVDVEISKITGKVTFK